jgi:hypothetical protein
MPTRPGYVWSGTEWISIGQEAAISPLKYQATEPVSPATGDIWIDSDDEAPGITSSLNYRWRNIAIGGETSISGNDAAGLPLAYNPGYEQVYLNGVLLYRGGDYTATTGTTITGLTALVAGDTIEVLSFVTAPIGDAYTQAAADAKFATTVNFPASAWTSYTPTFTNLTVGNGTINAAYTQIGKTVIVRISFTWGSTTSATSSPTIVSLPVAARNVGTSYGSGNAYIENSGIAGYIVGPTINTSTSGVAFNVIGTNGLISTAVTGAQPFTWGVADFFQTILTYEAA